LVIGTDSKANRPRIVFTFYFHPNEHLYSYKNQVSSIKINEKCPDQKIATEDNDDERDSSKHKNKNIYFELK